MRHRISRGGSKEEADVVCKAGGREGEEKEKKIRKRRGKERRETRSKEGKEAT